ncbi:YggT family protein [Chloroflexota bacterium]
MAILFSIIRIICDVLTILIIFRVIVFLYLPRQTNMLIRILHRVTEPMLAPLRCIIPRVGPLDFSS